MFLALCLCMVMAVPTFAAEEDNIDLQQIADKIITVSQTVQESVLRIWMFLLKQLEILILRFQILNWLNL